MFNIDALSGYLKVGDVVFISVKALPFQNISCATAC